MKIIKGFENEDIVVSDFGEWVGKDYIDYKAEYKRNQKFIEILLDENKKQQEVIDKIKKCFDDGCFEDGCDCSIIEKYIDNYLEEVSEWSR